METTKERRAELKALFHYERRRVPKKSCHSCYFHDVYDRCEKMRMHVDDEDICTGWKGTHHREPNDYVIVKERICSGCAGTGVVPAVDGQGSGTGQCEGCPGCFHGYR